VEEDTTTTSSTSVIEEVDEWFESPALATLTVDVKLYVTDYKYENKKQTHLLHLHCVPAVLAIYSKWFRVIIESAPETKLIEMPESFTYHCLYKSHAGGEIAVEKETVLSLFKLFHATHGSISITKYFQLMLMLFYIDSPHFFTKVESALNVTSSGSLIGIACWADYFKSDYLWNEAVAELKRTGLIHTARDLMVKFLKTMSKDFVDRLLLGILFAPK